MVSSKVSTAIVLSSLTGANAFVSPSPKQVVVQPMAMSTCNHNEDVEVSRRVAFGKSAAAFASIASIVTANPEFAFAAKAPPSSDELNRIKVGYERMCYLLDNFEQETTICRVSEFKLFFFATRKKD